MEKWFQQTLYTEENEKGKYIGDYRLNLVRSTIILNMESGCGFYPILSFMDTDGIKW